MTESTVTMQPAIREHFSARSALPKRELAQAESFINTLTAAAEKGERPTHDNLQAAADMLDVIDSKVEVAAFHAAVLAGQEGDMSAVNHKVESISRSIDQVSLTSERMRKVLADMR